MPSGHGADHNVQVDIFPQGGLPISFANERFTSKFGQIVRYEHFCTWISHPLAFEKWIIGRADALYQGACSAGVQEFGRVSIQKRKAQQKRRMTDGRSCRDSPLPQPPQPQHESRMIAALFPEPNVQRKAYRVSLRIGAKEVSADVGDDGLDDEHTPNKLMPSLLPPGQGASRSTFLSL
jgi:hypothetical protein